MRDYWTLPGFAELYLEDSWVLGITQVYDALTIIVDLGACSAAAPCLSPAQSG